MHNNFFFQAEDGIRDRNVTGVQTCALPISALNSKYAWLKICKEAMTCKIMTSDVVLFNSGTVTQRILAHAPAPSREAASWSSCRSEERRVGKEGRLWWGT